MAHDHFDWLILLAAGAIASVLLLAMTAYNANAGCVGSTSITPPKFGAMLPLVF